MRHITYIECKICPPHVFSELYKTLFCSSHQCQTHPGRFIPMVSQNAASPPVPFTPPPGLLEYLSMFVQNGSLPPPPGQIPTLPTPPAPPSSKGQSFTRAGHGQGGALADKQKASKDVMAAAQKRKSLVESDIETQPPLASGSTNKNPPGKSTAKHPKIVKVGHILSCFIDY